MGGGGQVLVLIRCASRTTHGKNWHYGRILNAHVIQKFLKLSSYQGFIQRGVALEVPLPPKKSEFFIIIINGNSEQN